MSIYIYITHIHMHIHTCTYACTCVLLGTLNLNNYALDEPGALSPSVGGSPCVSGRVNSTSDQVQAQTSWDTGYAVGLTRDG